MPLLVLFAQRHTRNVLSVKFFVQGRREKSFIGTAFTRSVLLGGWNFYIICFITLTFVSHLTTPKILATNLRPVLMMTKKWRSTKTFAGIIHVCANAMVPEQHNLSGSLKCTNNEYLKFINTFKWICRFDFKTAWMCFTGSITLQWKLACNVINFVLSTVRGSKNWPNHQTTELI